MREKMNKKAFEDYIEQFDRNNWMIDLKYHHTYRVVDYSRIIAKSLNLDKHDILLAETIGLLHDISRFSQATVFNTFNDNISFDHGNRGCEILISKDFIYKFVDNDEDKDLVLKAIHLHNKKDIDEDLTDRERLFCNIIRDADKLDIMDKQGTEIKDDSQDFNRKALEELRAKKLITYTYLSNDATIILSTLAFVFDLNFEESFNQLNKRDILKKKFICLRQHLEKEKVDEVENIINSFMKNKII